MTNKEVVQDRLLKRIHDLEKAGFNVTLTPNEEGWILKVMKNKPKIRLKYGEKEYFFYNYYLKNEYI
jgi:hypothetical protein